MYDLQPRWYLFDFFFFLSFFLNQTITYALSKAEVSAEREMKEEDRQVRPQNQVALIAVCDILPGAGKSTQTSKLYPPPPIILVTTHLKVRTLLNTKRTIFILIFFYCEQATKSEVGERFRLKEMQLLLAAVERCRSSIASHFAGRAPAVVIAGDLNACPTAMSSSSVNGVMYPSTVYPMIKKHPMGFRSVLNDDLLEYLAQQSFSQGENEDGKSYFLYKIRQACELTIVLNSTLMCSGSAYLDYLESEEEARRRVRLQALHRLYHLRHPTAEWHGSRNPCNEHGFSLRGCRSGRGTIS